MIFGTWTDGIKDHSMERYVSILKYHDNLNKKLMMRER